MIRPIVAYGDPVLRKKCEEIDEGYEDLKGLIDDMYETMYQAHGVGLAAPQIGESVRLFVVDSTELLKLDEEDEGELTEEPIVRAFINPQLIEESGDGFNFTEGCLSIPEVREDVNRKPDIRLRYMDLDFQEHEETFEGLNARVIQHEYDHIEGVLFVDHIKPLKRRMLKKQLDNISVGKVDVSYKMKFPFRKR